jgi:DNA-binding transcriptional MerR regulator
MYKISEFAAVANVTVRQLHHYDQLGLLKPAYTEPFSGYRYYTPEQLMRVNRILALKDLGLSLDEVGELLTGELSDSQWYGLLRCKYDEVHARITHDQGRLALIAEHLRLLEAQAQPDAQVDVVIKAVRPVNVLSFETLLDDTAYISDIFRELLVTLRALRLGPAIESSMCLYWHHRSYQRRTLQRYIEAAYTVATWAFKPVALPGGKQLTPKRLEGYATVASAMHCGPDETRHLAHQAMHQWVTLRGYSVIAPVREIYWRRGNPEAYLTEIQFPVEAAQ